MRRRHSLFACFCLAACAGEASQWRLVPNSDRTAAQQAQLAKAEAARTSLQQALLAELTTYLRQHGPRSSISVCKVRAPDLAAEVSQQHGVRIGRTAVRRRSTENQPPAWAAPLLEGADDGPITVAGPNGVLGGLFAIPLQPMCVQCHGQVDELAPGVAEALRTLYPRDQATGFRVGERRGWFWAEVGPIQ